MPNSVIDAVKQGVWDFEPETAESEDYDSTAALPGSGKKLEVLAQRLAEGLPLWHPSDRRSYDDEDVE